MTDQIKLCWKVLKSEEGSLSLRIVPDDQRVVWGGLDLCLKDGSGNWPRLQAGDELIVTIKKAPEK